MTDIFIITILVLLQLFYLYMGVCYKLPLPKTTKIMKKELEERFEKYCDDNKDKVCGDECNLICDLYTEVLNLEKKNEILEDGYELLMKESQERYIVLYDLEKEVENLRDASKG